MKTLVFILLLLASAALHAADSTASKITLHTYLEQNDVPQNREAVYHVELSWEGDLQRYHISQISTPVLTNLTLRGSGSANRFFTDEQGKSHSLKRITYYLKPVEMGMAYIDGITVQYEDTKTQQKESLSAQRLGVKIIEAVPEAGAGVSAGVILFYILLVVFLAVFAYSLWKYFKIRNEEQEETAPELSLEERFLEELNLLKKDNGNNPEDGFHQLMQLTRRYFSDKFELNPAAGFNEIKKLLEDKNAPADLFTKLERLYRQGELSQFAGASISDGDFHLFTDTVELLLQSGKED